MNDCPVCGSEASVGYEVRGVYDGILYWVCAKGHAYPRFTDPEYRLTAQSIAHAEKHNEDGPPRG